MNATLELISNDLAEIATRAAIEGIPVGVIARILDRPFDVVYGVLIDKQAEGVIIEIPKSDWPPTAKMSDRQPSVQKIMPEDDIKFLCHKIFGLTNLEAAFLALLMKHEHAAKEKLHHVVETQRQSRSAQPESMDTTDPKMVDVMICKLRKKLKRVDSEFLITTVWGGGYYIEPAAKAKIRERLNAQPSS